MTSYRCSHNGKDLVPNWETWVKKRKVFMLCAQCSREQWENLLAIQNVGAEIELIVRDGVAENAVCTWHAVLSDWRFKDSDGGVWETKRRPQKPGVRVKFVKVQASNNQGK